MKDKEKQLANEIKQDLKMHEEKHKQIEEMAKDLKEVETDVGHILINETFSYVKEHKKYNPKKDFSNAHTKTFEELTAEEMFKKGYRNCKDSVVLSREEHEILVKTAQGKIGNMKANDFIKACLMSGFMVEAVSTEEQVKQAYKKGSKETAEKIWLQAKAIVDSTKHIVQGREYLHIDALKEIVKSCGVEIKE